MTGVIFPVAGVSFAPGYPQSMHDLRRVLDERFDPDEPLAVVLRRNPANPHDANAIEVHVPAIGRMVGHVPRGIAVRLAARLDAGETFAAYVCGVRVDPRHPDRPGMDITVQRVTETVD